MFLLEFFKARLNTFRWIMGGFFAAFAVIGGFHWTSLFFLAATILMFPIFMHLQKNYIVMASVVFVSVSLFCTGALTSPALARKDVSHDATLDERETVVQTDSTSQSECETLGEHVSDITEGLENEADTSEGNVSDTVGNKVENLEGNTTENVDTNTEVNPADTAHPFDTSQDTEVERSESSAETSDSTEGGIMESTISETTAETEREELLVWVSGSGKKYHAKSTCSGMKEPRSMLVEEAEEAGYEPCKKCYS